MPIRGFHILPVACILLVIATHGQAQMTPAQYWKSVLPNTPIPTIISWVLSNQNKAVLPASTITAKPDDTGSWGIQRAGAKDDTVLPASTITARPDDTGTWGVQRAGGGQDDKPQASTGNTAFYFFEKDLLPGTKMKVNFVKPVSGVSFLPRRAADAIPFSTAKLPEILARFRVQPGSFAAEAMGITLQYCESLPVRGEKRRCATSLESMVDFAVASLGTNRLEAVSTVSSSEDIPEQQYTVQSAKKIKAADGKGDVLACHFEPYPYAVFLCHTLPKTTAYMVTLAGEGGAGELEAVAVCHADTGTWNPQHAAFKVMHVQPGTVPICHFSKHGVVWTALA